MYDRLKFSNWQSAAKYSVLIVVINFNYSYASQNVPVPVPKNIIYAGQAISRELLRERRVPKNYLMRVNVIASLEQLRGKIARTTLMPGLPISINHIVEQDVVTTNQPTVMHYYDGALHISVKVRPLNNAKAGKSVRARNIRSGIVVTGIAQDDGTISIGGN